MSTLRAEYAEVRERRANRQEKSKLLRLEDARSRRPDIDWEAYEPPTPNHPGIHVIDSVSVSDLRGYIDWTPFFQAWELHGKHPAILTDSKVGEQARLLLADAEKMLDRIHDEGLLEPRAVVGLFPANADGDDIRVRNGDVTVVLHHLRQQFDKGDRGNNCLADYIAPLESGGSDWIGAFAVTSGPGAEIMAAAFEAEYDDYSSIMVKALADRLAEALAELMHARVRTDLWGYADREAMANDDLIAESYAGIRPAPGYPACPDHTEKQTLFELLEVENSIGVSLTESFAMLPGASVSGWYFAHPDSHYFGVGRVARDQVEDYARRKGWSLEETERWLSPNLGYDPVSKP